MGRAAAAISLRCRVLTTFFGLLPLLFERSAQSEWLVPMAVTLGFGVLGATAITLLLVPTAALALDRWLQWVSPGPATANESSLPFQRVT